MRLVKKSLIDQLTAMRVELLRQNERTADYALHVTRDEWNELTAGLHGYAFDASGGPRFLGHDVVIEEPQWFAPTRQQPIEGRRYEAELRSGSVWRGIRGTLTFNHTGRIKRWRYI